MTENIRTRGTRINSWSGDGGKTWNYKMEYIDEEEKVTNWKKEIENDR